MSTNDPVDVASELALAASDETKSRLYNSPSDWHSTAVALLRPETDRTRQDWQADVSFYPAAIDLLKGSQIDYVDTLMGAGFTVNNPNAVAACGCGSSFRTADDAGTARACAH